jgi:hypothetical protein
MDGGRWGGGAIADAFGLVTPTRLAIKKRDFPVRRAGMKLFGFTADFVFYVRGS